MNRLFSLRLDDVLENLSGVFLVLLFPGFFVYHSLLALGSIPGFLAGWFGPISLLGAVLFMPSLLLFASRSRARFGVFLVLAFLSLLMASACMVLLTYALDNGISAFAKSLALSEYLTTVTAWIALFSVGYYIRLDSRLVKRVQLLAECLS